MSVNKHSVLPPPPPLSVKLLVVCIKKTSMQYLSCFYRQRENQVFIDNLRYNGTCLIFTEHHRFHTLGTFFAIKWNSEKMRHLRFLQTTIKFRSFKIIQI